MPAKLSRLPIIKMSATGNDFLLIDLRKPTVAKVWMTERSQKPRAHWVKLWCDRHEGLGADGLVFLEHDKTADFKWDFYNSDGSSAEMCGNAARAVSLYVHGKNAKTRLSFNTRVGRVDARVLTGKKIEVRLPAIAEQRWNQLFSWKGAKAKYDFVRAGVPHVVVQVPNLDERARLRELALVIKALPEFTKDGTNVTFVRLDTADRVQSVTFERGVEDFTLACGTGAVAAAHSLLRGEEGREVEVQVPGGALIVLWKEGFPILRGPAKFVAKMYILK